MTVRAIVAQGWAAAQLRAAGVASPQVEARLLLGHLTGLSATDLLLADVDDATVTAFEALIMRRCAGEPLQHITGSTWFRGVEILVGPGVFIPRPETELVAGAAIDEALTLSEPLVVELCAGTGAISAAITDEVPGARVIAVERESAAAEWLRRNVESRGVRVVEADMADALPELDAQVAIVVANPPYIAWSELDELPADVREHDPHSALFAADNGLAAVSVVAETASRLLRPGGLVIIEHGDDQSADALAILGRVGFEQTTGHRDLAGRDRFVTARWAGRARMEP